MGVKHLWAFLSPVKKEVTIESLNGQIIAVDLSIWIMEAQTQFPKHVAKPHLRHLFFRVNHLLQLGIIPLIVVEGVPPDLKQDTMRNRLGSVNGGKVKRSRFNALHRECCEMLECMGLPYIQAAGEAEAMCAYMNAEGLVDGCITNDGDAFLYGARIVYRNFSIDKKDPHMEAYDAEEIKEKLKLSKETLVGLAVLCGCDYLPKGVEGCGKETIRKFLETLNGDSLIERFNKWASVDRKLLNYKSQAFPGFDNIELAICKKALTHPDFPFKKIISEFLVNRNKTPSVKREWSRPNLIRLVRFAYEKMEWPEEYTASKVIPLLTLYDMKQIINRTKPSENVMKPNMIVKSRKRQSEPIYEVQWQKLDYDVYTKDEFYVTLEEQKLFQLAFPLLVGQYEASKGQKQKTSKRSTKTQITKKDINKDVIGLNELLNNVVISEKKVTTKQVKVKEVYKVQKNEPTCEKHIEHVLESDVTESPIKEQLDESVHEYVPLKERLKLQNLQKDGCHESKIIKSNLKEFVISETPKRVLCAPSPPSIEDYYSDNENLTPHLSTSLDKDAFGNFEIETSLLDFSIYQTPMTVQKYKSILTPQHKIELITTPAKPRKFRQLSNDSLNDSFKVELPLLERLKLKMGKN